MRKKAIRIIKGFKQANVSYVQTNKKETKPTKIFDVWLNYNITLHTFLKQLYTSRFSTKQLDLTLNNLLVKFL